MFAPLREDCAPARACDGAGLDTWRMVERSKVAAATGVLTRVEVAPSGGVRNTAEIDRWPAARLAFATFPIRPRLA